MSNQAGPKNALGIDASKMTPELLKTLRDTGMADIADEIEAELNDTPTRRWYNKFITCYPKMQDMKDAAVKLSKVEDCVLINGPTGTGKEIIARILHGDRKGSFVAINCGGLPEHLIESELFGHVKGAFTGAVNNKTGYFETAAEGTIFMDEIGDMPLPLQVKLLRVLQEKTIRPVGSTDEVKISCRIVCATHRDIARFAQVGIFREDLFYRISTFVLSPEPLSVRSADIPLIVRALDVDNRIKDINAFCARIKADMLGGNVRALEQLVRRFYVLGVLP